MRNGRDCETSSRLGNEARSSPSPTSTPLHKLEPPNAMKVEEYKQWSKGLNFHRLCGRGGELTKL
ncbi:hypothetical protein M407DRAFT_174110 [Tulasnella calospora MUT 4182]|uniref:Uncharacterized protein n=1 Tax=Tulasnella calospora MUT 4182 TaxID=1051891 RepID=A0A0C3Q2Z2_9AGAM|nr:hypothetical protein M407DRAFT_174110 [Tulasnella calospora MUT 4182]